MHVNDIHREHPNKKARPPAMDTLVIIGILIAYFALQRWILPRLGVPT